MKKHSKSFAGIFGSLVLVGACAAMFSARAFASGVENQGVVIGTDQKTGRPNILIAWRNTERILETEVEVKNLSEEQVTGAMSIAIIDGEGKVLLKSPGPG